MTLALIAASFMGLLLALRHGRPSLILLSMAILLFHALPLALLDPDAMSATLQAQIGTATAIAGLSSLAWYAGYWLFSRSSAASAPLEGGVSAGPKLFHALVLLTLLGLITAAPGGLFGFAQAGFLRLPVDSFLFSLTYACACLAAFTTALRCAHAASGRSALPWLSMALVLLVFWLLGGRTQFAITGITFGLILLAHRRLGLSDLVLPAIVAAILLTLTLSFRLTLQGEATDLSGSVRLTLSQLSLLESYALAARLVEEAGYQAGHYWQVLQQLFPRALFPEKPLQLSRALRLMEARDGLGGLTPGLAGEAFVAGGFIGVVAIGIAFGGALALLDNAYRALGRLQPLMQALVASLIPLLAIFTLRGGFDTTIFRLVILVLAASIGSLWHAAHAPRLPKVLS
ncbi:hypothetical protein JP75_01240 [Devosia riboflavina]|uniref:Uncharacterized protein n=1 Tax=Devosia riboflavina TaxID=46914 RepID=A0A087M7E9_9HYPH|nr:hypothetical protein [Devosia riboflavina]KFL32802.1 hypothetical protein JP75_01240 [Devosia riboflavina]